MWKQTLTKEHWQAERASHRERVHPWTTDRVTRSLRGEKHPVYDFLFEYYHFRPAHLARYSPGLGVHLEAATPQELDWPRHFSSTGQGAVIEPQTYVAHRIPMLRWTIRFLQAVLDRPPVYHCFGMHEWAMVYRSEAVRHARIPLRLADSELAHFVEGQHLCCTHFDAFRFFTPAALPRNKFQLNRLSVNQMDQPGCIHANMDLYKWAYQLAPFIHSNLVADAFELAYQAREIDMRASPYDLSALEFSPIAIETKAGREEYVQYQKLLFERSQPLRQRLLNAYIEVEHEVSAVIVATSYPAETIQTVKA